MNTQQMPAWSPTQLHRHLNQGSPLAVLDLRNREEFDAWKIEGKVPFKTINLPYFDWLDLGEEN